MDKNAIVQIIENFAPPSLAESWDCSGWIVETGKKEIKRVMLALTVTEDIVQQALVNGCDMIISHHPLFYVPLNYKDIDIYCAHTNLDKAYGGTTDELIHLLELPKGKIAGEFLRIANYKTKVLDFAEKLCKISDNVRVVNNKNVQEIEKIAFCAGSGSEFIEDAVEQGADAFVTGDIKFHTAVESPVILFDIGHFESEIPVLKVFAGLLEEKIEIIFADEKSPFKSI